MPRVSSTVAPAPWPPGRRRVVPAHDPLLDVRVVARPRRPHSVQARRSPSAGCPGSSAAAGPSPPPGAPGSRRRSGSRSPPAVGRAVRRRGPGSAPRHDERRCSCRRRRRDDGRRCTRCPTPRRPRRRATATPSTLGRDRDGVLGQVVEEVHGAVDRVDHPAHAGPAGLVVPLLAEEAVVGSCRPDPVPDQLLAVAVRLGDDVDVAGLRGGHLDRAPSPVPDQRRGLAGDLEGEVEQGLRHESTPPSAGRSPRGLGQQPSPQRSHQAWRLPTARRRGLLTALGRGALDQQRRGPSRRTAGPRRASPRGRRGGRASRPWPGPRCRGRRRPPCGRTRNRSGSARRPGTPSAASRSRWSLTSGSSHGTCGGPDLEQ